MPEPVGHVSWRQVRTRTSGEPLEATPERRDLTLASLTYILIALYALAFAAISIREHESFNTNAFDLGNMDQAAWNTMQGRWLEFSNWEGGTTRLAAHVEPTFILVAQLYRFYSDPKLLLVLQALVLSSGALPAFWLARDRLKNDFAGMAFAGAYLLAPPLQAANLADFHPVTLSSALLLFAFYFVSRGHYRAFFLTAVIAMGTKEQVPLSVMLIGFYIWWFKKERFWGLLTVVVGALWALLAFGVVIPHFNPQGASPYVGRYRYLGGSTREIISHLLLRPWEILPNILEADKVDYLHSLLRPLLYLPLISPVTLIFALPDLTINLLSNFPQMHSLRAHYGAVLVPYLIISAILGTYYLTSLLGRFSQSLGKVVLYALCLGILVVSLSSYTIEVFLPLWDHLPQVTPHHRLADRFIKLIPPQAPISTNSVLNPHVSQRQKLYLFPDVKDAEYIFLDVTSNPYPIDAPTLKWRVDHYLSDPELGVLAAEDGYLLLQRGLSRTDLPPEFYSFVRVDEPSMEERVDATFGGILKFHGFDLQPRGPLHGGPLDANARMNLYWEALRPLGEDYLIVLYTKVGGTVIDTRPYHPATVWYPTSDWQPGEIVKVEVPWLALGPYPKGDVWLGVVSGKETENLKARLKPTVKGRELGEEGTLIKLADLRAG